MRLATIKVDLESSKISHNYRVSKQAYNRTVHFQIWNRVRNFPAFFARVAFQLDWPCRLKHFPLHCFLSFVFPVDQPWEVQRFLLGVCLRQPRLIVAGLASSLSEEPAHLRAVSCASLGFRRCELRSTSSLPVEFIRTKKKNVTMGEIMCR